MKKTKNRTVPLLFYILQLLNNLFSSFFAQYLFTKIICNLAPNEKIAKAIGAVMIEAKIKKGWEEFKN